MGWWEEDGLTQGDEPFDICQWAFKQIISKYQHHIGRPPSLPELLVYLRHALNTVGADAMPDLENIEVTSITIKSKKTPKRQNYGIGDYFAIPLDGEFAYGRIVHESADMLVEIYELFTETMLTLPQLLSRQPAVRTWKYVFSIPAFRRRRWIILGSAEIEPEYEFPLFYMGGKLPLANIRGLPHRYSRSDFGTHPENLEGIESHSLWGPEFIEEHLKARTPDPWPQTIEHWKKSGIPWRGKKTKYPVFYKDLPLKDLRGIRLELPKFSDADMELILRLKNAEFVTIKCEAPLAKKKRDKVAETLKNKLPKLRQIYIDDECQRLNEETGTWSVDE